MRKYLISLLLIHLCATGSSAPGNIYHSEPMIDGEAAADAINLDIASPLASADKAIHATDSHSAKSADNVTSPAQNGQALMADVRQHTLACMEQVMGKFPQGKRCDLQIHTLEETDCGTYVRRLITYCSEAGSSTPAYLLIPKAALTGDSRLPGILALHSTNVDIGHKVVVGLGSLPNRDYGHELALRGNVVIAPAYPMMGGYHPDLKGLGYESGTMKAIWDNIRALDVLDSLPYVLHNSYGVIGHSLGGHNGLFTAAFDFRIKCVVCSCGFDSFQDYKDGDLSGWCQEFYMPRLLQYSTAVDIPFDFDDVLAAIAPRPVFINAPLHDDNFHWDSVDKVVKRARSKIEAFNTKPDIRVEHPDCNHDFPNAVREKAYEFLMAAP